MSAGDAAKRLTDLEQILAQSRTPASASDNVDPVALYIADVPMERIRRFTAELQSSNGVGDEIASVTTRLLLNDYSTAVAHLRAVARIAVKRIDSAVNPIRDCQKFIRREEKLAMRRAAAAAVRDASSRS